MRICICICIDAVPTTNLRLALTSSPSIQFFASPRALELQLQL